MVQNIMVLVQLSVAVVVKNTGVPDGLEHSTTRLVEQVISGSSPSITVTVNMQVETCPHALVALNVTVFVPTGKVDPDGGLEPAAMAPGQQGGETAVGENVTTAEH